MTDTLISGGEEAETLLRALGDQLWLRREHFSLVVVGGSALLVLGLISRATRDVDVLAILDGENINSATPLPLALLDSALTVARDFGLPDDWLNPGPISLLDLGLPKGFYDRTVPRDYGSGLKILFASRLDQIYLKLYATVDQGAGKHLKDLEALEPTEAELLDAARWSRTHDPSEGYRRVLASVLAHFGIADGNLDV